MSFEHMPGAPTLYQLGYGTGVGGLSGDGQIAVGDFGRGGPVFRWTAATGPVSMNVPSTGEANSISRNGHYISSNLLDVNTDTSLGAYRWDTANGWLPTAHAGSCDGDSTFSLSVDDLGSVYGLTNINCTHYRAWKWNPQQGSVLLASPANGPDGKPANARIDQTSADGQTQVGLMVDPTGLWEGVVWNAGVPSRVLTSGGEPVDEIGAVSGDGTVIGGATLERYVNNLDYPQRGFLRRAQGTAMQFLQPLPGDADPARPAAMSRDGSVVAGFSGNPFLSFNPGPFLWTRQMGTVNLDEFVRGQGTAMEQWASLWEPTSVSDDGRTIAGWGNGFLGPAGWVLKIDTAFVCHRPAGTSVGETLSVAFPQEFDQHLAQGDAVGRCP